MDMINLFIVFLNLSVMFLLKDDKTLIGRILFWFNGFWAIAGILAGVLT